MEIGIIIPTTGELTTTILRTVIIFLYTFLVLRILGKRQVSQFTWFDILIVIALGSAVGDVMIYPENELRLFTSMAAIFVVVVLVRILTYLMVRSPKVETVIEGQEMLLVQNGQINIHALRKADMTEHELNTLLREKGYMSLQGIDTVILETNDDISIVKKHSRRKKHN